MSETTPEATTIPTAEEVPDNSPVAPTTRAPRHAVAGTVAVLALIAGFGLGHVTAGSTTAPSTASCHEAFTNADELIRDAVQTMNLAGQAIVDAANQDAAAVNGFAEQVQARTAEAGALRDKYNAAKAKCP